MHGIDQSIRVKELNDKPTTLNNADMPPTHLACGASLQLKSETVFEMGHIGGVCGGGYESQSPIARLQTRCGSDYGP